MNNNSETAVTSFATKECSSVSSPTPTATDIVLLSVLYPPAVGGSAVLYQNVYGRLARTTVSVVTDSEISPGPDGNQDGIYVYRRRFETKRWGVLGFGPLRDHRRTIRALRSVPFHERTLIHSSRALPEGVSVWLGSFFHRWRYLCWAHGEELTTAALSREFAFLLKRSFSSAAAVLANSHNTKSLLESIGIAPEQIAVVHPGVDATRFRPETDAAWLRQRYAPNGELLIVTIARLQRRKGHDHALQALAQLRRHVPNVRYLVVGDGEERPRLEALAEELGVRACAHFTGKVPEADLPAYFAAGDVFLHPNRIHEADSEGFGIVFLEAQATGRPVVGGNTGGVPETMIAGETGLLVSGEDVAETVSALRPLLENKALRSRMGEAGRRHVVQNFSWEKAARAVEEVHHQVLAHGTLRAARTSRL
jgi:phosphatidylinositol alpha-1,6-mannosyltransferase